MPATRLYCLPYAGGSSLFYGPLGERLKPDVTLCTPDYPGHGMRMGGEVVTSMDDLMDDMYAQLQEEGLREPFALLGYSMGATVAYHLYFYLKERGIHPQHLFLLSNTPPYVADEGVPSTDLDDDAFLAELAALGGMPQELLESRELIELFLPLLRADVRLEEVGQVAEPTVVDANMTVLYGREDSVCSKMGEWRRCAGGQCELRAFDGGHFFMLDHYADVAEIINRTL